MANSREEWAGGLFGLFGPLPAAASVLTGFGVLAWQSWHWLQFAKWPSMTLRDGLHWLNGTRIQPFTTGFLGLDKIVGWAFDGSPLVLWLVLILPVAWLIVTLSVLSLLLPAKR